MTQATNTTFKSGGLYAMSSMYTISHYGKTNTHDYTFYSSHGEFGGVKDVISYGDINGAKKFFTQGAAERFIANELPESLRINQKAVPIDGFALMLNCPEDYAKLLEWERNRKMAKVTFCINPEDSMDVDIMQFYDRLAEIWGLDPANTGYDCTKIEVSRNIQSNIFEMLNPSTCGTLWALRGPKTEHSFLDNTVELTEGFFIVNDEPVAFSIKTNHS